MDKVYRDALDHGLSQIPARDLRRLLKHIEKGKPMLTKSASIFKVEKGKAVS